MERRKDGKIAPKGMFPSFLLSHPVPLSAEQRDGRFSRIFGEICSGGYKKKSQLKLRRVD
jgi:hypothetical protein